MKRLLKQPKGLWVLSFGKSWDTFSYYGTQVFLAIYLAHIFHFSHDKSYLIYGAYAAVAFSTPIIGGIIADKWLGQQRTLVFGSVLNILGNLLLISNHFYFFALGLATSAIGAGLYKSTATHLVGTLYKKGDATKEAGYTWFYLSMNLGGTLAPLFYGLVAYLFAWRYAFLCSAIGVLIGLSWLLVNLRLFQSTKKPAHHYLLCYPAIILACFLLSIPFYIPSILNPLIGILFVGAIIFLALTTLKHQGKERTHILALLIICSFAMCYYMAGLQIGITIAFFIQTQIKQGGINTQLPASTFGTLYCLFVLILAPLFTYAWSKGRRQGFKLTAPTKLSIGLAMTVLAFVCFMIAATNTGALLFWIIIGIAFLSAGELALAPAIYTIISDLTPPGLKSTMMGAWLLFIAFGGYLSSTLANVANYYSTRCFSVSHLFLGDFTLITLFTLIVLISLIMCIPKLNNMIK